VNGVAQMPGLPVLAEPPVPVLRQQLEPGLAVQPGLPEVQEGRFQSVVSMTDDSPRCPHCNGHLMWRMETVDQDTYQCGGCRRITRVRKETEGLRFGSPEDVKCAITKNMYRDALHVYLKHAWPDDDESYYSKWAGLAVNRMHPEDGFWERRCQNPYDPYFPFPTEVRFGCWCSGNTKLRCYPTGFMFDTNCSGDSDEITAQVRAIAKQVEAEWERIGLPVHSRRGSKKTDLEDAMRFAFGGLL